ncbi:MAG TPA: class I SAM-dependent methyltransferase [Steroidobacteraceae bacterium]|nr:class I SAM-dependent methyltransferase [Steroidobacteraceae bacterium]
MRTKPRRVRAELLDDLPPENPQAQRSRRDLRRVHHAMNSVSILRRAVTGLRLAVPPRRILELGAGEGICLLRLARVLNPRWTGVEVTLLDRHDLVTEATRRAYRELGWIVTMICADALAWAQEPVAERYDLCIATLFLHHFDTARLSILLSAAAARTDAFVCGEPRRDFLGRVASASIGVIGANRITREDAVTSVAAGFRGRELSTLWARAAGDWNVAEFRALPFMHCFTAVRATAARGGGDAP